LFKKPRLRFPRAAHAFRHDLKEERESERRERERATEEKAGGREKRDKERERERERDVFLGGARGTTRTR
jgi:hypothetical protein